MRATVFSMVAFGLALSVVRVHSAADPAAAPDPAAAIRPLAVGASVPAVQARTADGAAFDLLAAVTNRPTVLLFYRGGWCPYCNTHLGQMQAVERDLVALGYQILALSPDRPALLAETAEKNKVAYVLLSDASMEVAQAFGLAFRVDDATVERYRGYGIDLAAAAGATHQLLPVPAVFVTGTDGRVRFAYADPDYKTRLAPAAVLEAAKAALR